MKQRYNSIFQQYNLIVFGMLKTTNINRTICAVSPNFTVFPCCESVAERQIELNLKL